MNITRRDFGKFALAGFPAATALLSSRELFAAPAKPNSHFAGVWIGVIAPYSYLSQRAYDAPTILGDITGDGISGCEIEAITVESYAGAPNIVGMDGEASPNGFSMGRGGRRGPGGPGGPGRAPGGAPAAAPGARRGFGRRSMTPEQQAAMQAATKKAQTDLTTWRLAQPMTKYKELRTMYSDAGVSFYALKLTLAAYMPDPEFDYAFNVAKTLGARALQMEHPGGNPAGDALTDRIGQFASKHKFWVGYHAHTQARPDTWDTAMKQSPYNGINLDIGHYVAAGNHDVVKFIQEHHDRITTLHLKDRCYPDHNNGANEPWGQGDTPLVDILHLMRDRKYGFPGSIELEYRIPEGSSANAEIAKCVAYAQHALTT